MKLTQITILALMISLCGHTVADDTIPGAPQKKAIALVGGIVHPASGPAIKNGVVVFDNGKIVSVGAGVAIPGGAEIIDVKGKHIYPGLFEAHSALGLTEVSSTRSTVDHSEAGSLNPNVQANRAVNPDSALIPVTRSNGILFALSSPQSGTISGRASVMQLDGWTFEDMTIKDAAAMMIQWPRMEPVFRAPGDEPAEEQEEERDSALEELRDLFRDARLYSKGRDAQKQKFDIRLASMKSVIDGELPLLVRADSLAAIQSAVMFAVEQKVRLIILGGYAAPDCADLLKKHKVPVIVSAIHRRPRSRSDAYDAAYTLPLRLQELGIQYCISGTDASETWNTRNLPYQAGYAVAFGLDKQEALKAITLYPAQILGVDKQIGSLEAGKDASLFVATGDTLQTSSNVTHAWIQGRKVDLNDKHKRLYNKYSEKYRRLGAR